MSDHFPPVEITVYENGPVLVRGDFKLQTPHWQVIGAGHKTIALCRCALPALRAFCDGNHVLRQAVRRGV